MAQRGFQFNPPTNPILQVLYFVVGGIVLIGAILMSAFVLAIALGVAIIIGIVVYVRVWWLRRKFRAAAGKMADSSAASDGDVLEVEYTVVEERDVRDDRSDS